MLLCPALSCSVLSFPACIPTCLNARARYDMYGSLSLSHTQSTTTPTIAVRARKFILSLLEFEGVQEAIVEAGGWSNVEAWASALNK